jgi:RNA polymerase sigma-70 factor (ECF subfamily)
LNPVDLLCRLQALSSQIKARRRRLHRLALSWCRDRSLADDLVQETFLKALRHLNQLRDVASMDAWLSNILFNSWRDHVRSRRHTEDIDQLSDLEEFMVACEDEKGDVVGRVHSAIDTLPLAQREVLALVDLHGYSYTEVAALLDIPTGTVTSRISRAREALREQLMDFVAVTPQVIQLRKVQ